MPPAIQLDAAGMTVCPSCQKAAPLTDKGVCFTCLKYCRANHRTALLRQANHEDRQAAHQAAESHIEPSTPFNYQDVEEALGIVHDAHPDAVALAAEFLGDLFRWVYGNGKISTALLRITAVGAGLHPEYLGEKTYLQLSKELGVTKAAVSKTALQFADVFNLKLRRSRQMEGRLNMSRSRLAQKPRPGTYGRKSQPTPKK